MAYQRYSRQSDWYIFWETSQANTREDERLAVWHVNHRAAGHSITYQGARDMLAADDFSRILGFCERDRVVVREAIEEFVTDVDEKYGQAAR